MSVHAQEKNKHILLDSIQKLRLLSTSNELTTEIRRDFAERAVELSIKTKEDSVIIKSKRNLAYFYLLIDYYDTFKELNNSIIDLANKSKDTLSIAYANHNLGWYYQVQAKQDSSYYHYFKARKFYRQLNDKRNEGEVLLNMVSIQMAEKDYIGAETNAFEAIKLIDQLPKSDHNLDTMYSLHNSIGLLSDDLKLYDKAIEYYQKSLEYVKGFKNYQEYEDYSLNNIGVSYLESNRYTKALEIYNRLLSKEYIQKDDPSLYATILNNLANAKYKSNKNYNYNEVESLFSKALDISISIQDPISECIISLDLAEFYISNSKFEEANLLVDKSLNLSKETNSSVNTIAALKLKANLEKGEKGKTYFNLYSKLNDSLINKERAIRNKFARIEFETDEIKAENVQISKERLIFLISSIGLTVLLILIYIVITQRAKNQELRFIQQQQETNEEIYNLMLAQQDKIDEGRTVEKKRISQELHDGILGRLFGTRLSLDSLNFVSTEEAAKSRSQYIKELMTIESDIRKISHDLNTDFISESGFIDIIKALIESQTKAYKLDFDFTHDSQIDWDSMSNKNKIHIYRILQESMQNIYKHAKASLIKIGFEQKNDVILLNVQDNGIGFNTAKARKGIGLKNIDARVRELGGRAEIYSKKGLGTTIKIFIPV